MTHPESLKSRYVVSEKLIQSRLSSAKPPRPLHRIRILAWTWEFLSLLLSTASVATILLLVGRYNHQPLPTWYCGLTLNGLISLLAVIAKASLIFPIAECISQLKWHWYWDRERSVADFERFDNASRGPWGSLILLCRPRLWNLASVGAVLTLIALAIEPSLQQIFTYVQTSTAVGSARMPVSLHYVDMERSAISLGQKGISSAMKGTFYSAMLGNMTTNPPEPKCTTGNCTWSPYSSVAVCHACQNLSSVLKFNPYHTGHTPVPFQAWELPNSMYLSNDSTLNRRQSNNARLMTFMTTSSTLAPVFFKNLVDSEIVHVDSIFFPPQMNTTNTPQAFECLLYFCVQTYHGTVDSGHFTENVASFWPRPDQRLDAVALPSGSQYQFSNTTGGIIRPPASSETYSIDAATMSTLKLWIRSVFGRIYDNYAQYSCNGLECDLPLATYTNYLFGTPLDDGRSNDIRGPDAAFERIAASMTGRMRQIADETEGAVGQAFAMQTTVQARWLWTVCPISLLVLGSGFVFWTVVASTRREVPTWKSSALATLLHGVDDYTHATLAVNTTAGIEAAAEDHVMAIRSNENHWLLHGSVKFNSNSHCMVSR